MPACPCVVPVGTCSPALRRSPIDKRLSLSYFHRTGFLSRGRPSHPYSQCTNCLCPNRSLLFQKWKKSRSWTIFSNHVRLYLSFCFLGYLPNLTGPTLNSLRHPGMLSWPISKKRKQRTLFPQKSPRLSLRTLGWVLLKTSYHLTPHPSRNHCLEAKKRLRNWPTATNYTKKLFLVSAM